MWQEAFNLEVEGSAAAAADNKHNKWTVWEEPYVSCHWHWIYRSLFGFASEISRVVVVVDE